MDAGATFAESYSSLERLPRWADVATSPATAEMTDNGSDIMYRIMGGSVIVNVGVLIRLGWINVSGI